MQMGPLFECMQSKPEYYQQQLEALEGASPGSDSGGQEGAGTGAAAAVDVDEMSEEELQGVVDAWHREDAQRAGSADSDGSSPKSQQHSG
ncbi:MAG: hypothetical protein WDW36_007394 [Sanguina aurantia]